MNGQQIFPYFIACWIAIGIGLSAIFYGPFKAETKRKVWMISTPVVALIFVGFVYLMSDGNPQMVAFVVPAVGLITFLNLKAVKFCDVCGAMIRRTNPFKAPNYCSKCGAPLRP